MNTPDTILQGLRTGDFRTLARCISRLESDPRQLREWVLPNLDHPPCPVLGITGPPGVGKSTLISRLLDYTLELGLRTAVLAVDPSSPFHQGALLGDRIRMQQHVRDARIFIRSLASRGSLGGLHPHIMEICELLQQTPFDVILIETVGVGQSEVDIAGLADASVVVLSPSSGDDIQAMKSGLLEIADMFVINKADLPGADDLQRHLMTWARRQDPVPVVLQAKAELNQGIETFWDQVRPLLKGSPRSLERKSWAYSRKIWQLIAAQRLRDIDEASLRSAIRDQLAQSRFHLYPFLDAYLDANPVP